MLFPALYTYTFTLLQSCAKKGIMFTDISSLYGKMPEEVDCRGFNVKDVPKDGDCALHAIIDQLHITGRTDEHSHYTVATLCRSAIRLLHEHPVDINFFD